MAAKKKAGDGAPAKPEARTEEVDGVAFEVYPDKLRSWTAVKVARELRGDDIGLDKLFAMVRLIELGTSLDEDAIVEHCGGQDAPFADVLAFAAEVCQRVFPKN